MCVALLAMTPLTALADMRGIDVSSWQSADVTCTADYDFAIVKVSQGLGYQNPNYSQQAACVIQRGKSLGLYHYATGANAQLEADVFVKRVNGYVGRAVLALDWESEQNSAWGNGDWVRTFVNRVHTLTGVWPLVYTSASALWQIPSDVRANCGLWVAQYANNWATGYQSAPWKLGDYGEAVRQYTSNGWVSGYNSRLDLNVFRGEKWQWDLYANPKTSIRPPNTSSVQSTPTTSKLSVVVRSGDTISGLAARYNAWPVTAWTVPSGNIDLIWPGQIVTYNGTVTAKHGSVVVRSGDTVSGIAARLGVSIDSIGGYRSGNINLIYPGEVLTY